MKKYILILAVIFSFLSSPAEAQIGEANKDAAPSSNIVDSAATTSAELAGVISDETGSGLLVFGSTPTLTTPVLGAATGTSVDLGGTSLFGSRALTVDTGGVFNIVLASAAGDDFTVDTSKLVVSGDSGTVGIGTVDPGSKLEVAGDAANTAENSAQLQLIGSTDANKQLRIGYNTTANNGFIQAVRVGTGQDALLLNPEGGNVGIGVTPAAKLDIDVGTGQVLIRTLNPDSLMITENDADIYGGEIALQKSRGSYASPGDVVDGDGLGGIKTSAYSGSAYWATAKIDYNIDGTFTSNQRPPSRMTFSTNTANAAVTERMRITGAGYVGIGTDAPTRPLSVYDASLPVVQLSNSTTGSNSTDGFQAQYVGTDAYLWNYEDGAIYFGTLGTSRMTITNAGRVRMPAVYSVAGTGAALNIESDGNLFRIVSARRYKDNINYDNVNGDVVYDLRPVSYTLKDIENPVEEIGFIAEDVEEIDPRLVVYSKEGTVDALHYGRFSVLLVKAMQDQKATYDATLTQLDARIQELEAALP